MKKKTPGKETQNMRNTVARRLAVPMMMGAGIAAAHAAENAPPNILMITTDDVGYYNVGAYNENGRERITSRDSLNRPPFARAGP